MPLFCATYEYTDDLDLLTKVRPEHRDWLASLPELMISGPTDANGAVLIFEGGSQQEIETLVGQDPLATAGVIARTRVVGWTPVKGKWLGVIQDGQD